MGTILNEEDLKQLTEFDLKELLESENKLYKSLGSNLYDKGEKLLKHIDLINTIIKEKRSNMENSILNNIGSLSIKDNTMNTNNNNNNNSFINENGRNHLQTKPCIPHHIKQLSVEESSQILQHNMIENKLSSLDKKFNEFGVESPNSIRKNRSSNSINNLDNTNSEMDDDEIEDNNEHDYVSPDELDDEVDSIDPFDDKPYDEGFNYKLQDEFHYFDDDT
ncbi:hypothetical protein DICPUDRAFT_147994 [Dictyostelium purpureum]|uniref:Uncharacterized protein n=1 Tax=Dictyostelium purpureum TaxID=5786 RepID=F0Z9Z0_DICPU|nr:uncharacterized protein DICPUDRAFT_147994 [Dictyostelium purpureum]EGC39236.1 hypothetical protein DICPUDRAFT_147994 [Dictyostelium purpureum]|eukprot:XP_003284263.1 hypothetical protein DICPUDRAFT_147994 [Dictyostelium purpureum]